MKKLTLNKEVVTNLSSQEMNVVKGLTGGNTCGETCACTMICPPRTYDLSMCICS